jgi:hypothetical protein
VSTSNRLPILAVEIRREHEAAEAASKSSVEHAIAAGSLLIEAKEQVKHGEWLPWLAANCSVPDRTARLYMRLARNRAEIEAKSATVADLTLRGAILLLTPDPGPEDSPVAEPRALAPGEIELPINAVKFRKDLFPRVTSGVKQDHVDRLLMFLAELPPIEINQKHEIIDGVHRWHAHKQSGASTIRAFVTEVKDDLDHLKIAIFRNSSHGAPWPIEVAIKHHQAPDNTELDAATRRHIELAKTSLARLRGAA